MSVYVRVDNSAGMRVPMRCVAHRCRCCVNYAAVRIIPCLDAWNPLHALLCVYPFASGYLRVCPNTPTADNLLGVEKFLRGRHALEEGEAEHLTASLVVDR